MAEMNLNRKVSDEELQKQKENPYIATEEELMNEGVEGKGITCRPQDTSDRFWDCSIQTVSPNNPNRKTILAPVDAVNDHTEDTETQTRATRVAATTVKSMNREKMKITGTCRSSSTSNTGTFCELKVEDA